MQRWEQFTNFLLALSNETPCISGVHVSWRKCKNRMKRPFHININYNWARGRNLVDVKAVSFAPRNERVPSTGKSAAMCPNVLTKMPISLAIGFAFVNVQFNWLALQGKMDLSIWISRLRQCPVRQFAWTSHFPMWIHSAQNIVGIMSHNILIFILFGCCCGCLLSLNHKIIKFISFSCFCHFRH